MKITIMRFYTALIATLFVGFCVVWFYDAATAPSDAFVSMFYRHESNYYTQRFPCYVGILLPLLLTATVLLLMRIRKARWGLCLGLGLLQALTKMSVGGHVYWFNPFHRNNVAAMKIDYIFGIVLYVSIIINIVYFLCLIIQGEPQAQKRKRAQK